MLLLLLILTSSGNTLLPTRPTADSDTLTAPESDDEDEADDEAESSGTGECAGLCAPFG